MNRIDNLTAVIPFFNGRQHINRLLGSLPDWLPVVIVDDKTDPPLQLGELPARNNLTLLHPPQKGYFTGAVNAGIAACNTDVLVLNQDVWFTGDGWVRLLQEKHADYAMIGERIRGQHPAHPYGYIHGTFMFLSRDGIEKCGLLDAETFPLWGSTCDFQLRLTRANFGVFPVESVPDFNHARKDGERFGSSISQFIKTQANPRRFTQTPPLVSVIIVSYNYGRFLPDAVNSLIGGETSLGYAPPQTLQGFEIILVDSGSTDGESLEIARSLADGWKGIRLLEMQPRTGNNGELLPNGKPAGLNAGFKVSNGRYIAVLDADDMMEPDRLRTMYTVSERNPHSLVYDDVRVFTVADGRGKVWKSKKYDYDRLIHKNSVHTGIMIPRQAMLDTGGYPAAMENGREDWAMNVALGLTGYCGVHTGKAHYLYRREDHNRTLRNTTPDQIDRFKRVIMQLYPQAYNGERPMACCGGRGSRTIAPDVQGTAAVAPLAGQNDGLVILEYVGLNAAKQPFYASSGNRYYAGTTKPYIYVDPADVNDLLNMYDGSVKVFRVYNPPAPAPEPEVTADSYLSPLEELEALAAPAAVETAVADDTPALELLTDDEIAAITRYVKDIEVWLLTDPSTVQVEQVLAGEQAGANRVTAVRILEDYISK